jgi:histidyl-tRNA synthetase
MRINLSLKKESMSSPVQTLKGFRDFLPEEKRKRDYVIAKMKAVYEKFGFEPIETPTLEYAELLLGKYGDEADKLVYNFKDRGDRDIALRYDQTVPTARILYQYQGELPRYFRRYQIQNVFRADKPQKGRYREFTQSDCDIFGSTDSLADAEVLAVFYSVYKELGLANVVIEINDRETLMSFLTPFSTPEVTVMSLTQSIDKLDKQTPAEVAAELVTKGLTQTAADKLLSELQKVTPSAQLQQIVDKATALGVPTAALKFNPNLARGLDYYTGLIFESRVPEYPSGSLGGGGRYDNLINQLSGYQMPAVGFAVGFDRTVEVLDELKLLPAESLGSQVLVTVFEEQYAATSLKVATQLRTSGIKTEVYPAVDKLGKQFKLADQKKILYVVIIGETEMAENTVALKNMKTGDQVSCTVEELIEKCSG